MKKLLLLLAIAAAAVIAWGLLRKSRPPRVEFARAARQTLVSTLPTNGKAEPFEWQTVRAEIAGVVSSVAAHEGRQVGAGALLATLSDPSLQADIAAAEAKLEEAKAALAAAEAGGRPAELAEIDNSIDRVRLNLQQQQRERDTLQRLAAKNAATAAEVSAAGDKVRQLELELRGLSKRRDSLVSKNDVAGAQARVRETQSALNLARDRASRGIVRAPLAGSVYELAARPGAYLNVGDPVCNIGRTDRMRVRVYVDEPELGRIHEGSEVSITWDALPGRQWKGTVERKPASIQALGSRQVGEVLCTIENPDRELAAGANVNAEIRTDVVENAVVIPKETLRRDAAGEYVLLLQGDRVERRPVRQGASSVTSVQIQNGLAEGDAVARPTDAPLPAGGRVTPEIR